MLTPKKEPDTGGSSLGRVLKKAFKKKEEAYDEEEAVRAAIATILNDVPPAPVEKFDLGAGRFPAAAPGGTAKTRHKNANLTKFVQT